MPPIGLRSDDRVETIILMAGIAIMLGIGIVALFLEILRG